MSEKHRGTMVDEWRGDPVFWRNAQFDDGTDYYGQRVFHRDKPGVVIAEFYGPNSRLMADRFCELFGEPDGSKAKGKDIEQISRMD